MNSVLAVRRDLNKTALVVREQVTSTAAGIAVTAGAPGGCRHSYLTLGEEERDVHDGPQQHVQIFHQLGCRIGRAGVSLKRLNVWVALNVHILGTVESSYLLDRLQWRAEWWAARCNPGFQTGNAREREKICLCFFFISTKHLSSRFIIVENNIRGLI